MKFIINKKLPNQSHLVIAELNNQVLGEKDQISLSAEELDKLNTITHAHRKIEFLTTRKIIQHLFNKEERIVYSPNGKPDLKNSGYKISISHSKTLAGIIINPNLEVGIDLQYETPKISRIQKKFLNDQELMHANNQMWPIHIYWCAKEALFKYYAAGNVQFNEHLYVAPFTLQPKGELQGELRFPHHKEHVRLEYIHHADTMIVYTAN